jgi:hypothetical protein
MAAWIAAGSLWAAEIAEGLASPNLLSAAMDMVLDGMTIVITLTLIGQTLLERYGLRHDGTRVITDDEYERIIRAITSGVVASQPDGDGGGSRKRGLHAA